MEGCIKKCSRTELYHQCTAYQGIPELCEMIYDGLHKDEVPYTTEESLIMDNFKTKIEKLQGAQSEPNSEIIIIHDKIPVFVAHRSARAKHLEYVMFPFHGDNGILLKILDVRNILDLFSYPDVDDKPKGNAKTRHYAR